VKSLTDQLTSYATYHRDRRNIATHFVGIPFIVLAIETLLARPAVAVFGVPVSPALLVVLGASVYYLKLDRRYGLAMSAVSLAALAIGHGLASLSTAMWLASGIGLFVIGWVFQLVGHVFEGKKPAFVDDLVGLLVGPLFVLAEVGFALGLRLEVKGEIERRAGPTRAAGGAVESETSSQA
jgi:uncharacterized membrane protein YGL010W